MTKTETERAAKSQASALTVLGLESSCDETAAAVIRMPLDGDGRPAGPGDILSNPVLSQIDLHAPYGGVVPEIAARAHISHMDRLTAAALAEAGLALNDVDAVAATAGPGLIGGLLVGLTTGKALALAAGKPFVGVNHLEGHALTARLTGDLAFPYLLLLVSGGHCQLVAVDGPGRYSCLGSTLDDAVGEAFDKAAKLMSLGYPGGPEIERRARDGDASAVPLPRPLLDRPQHRFDFSFSGLKTALRQQAEKRAPLDDAAVADLSASFQAAVIDCLTDRCRNAMQHIRARPPQAETPALVVAGGVAANQAIGAALAAEAAAAGFALHVPPPALCTDNAAMIAWAGAENLAAGRAAETDAMAWPARARWPLDTL